MVLVEQVTAAFYEHKYQLDIYPKIIKLTKQFMNVK